MRKKNSQKLVIGVLFLLVFFLGFFQNAKVSKAQPQYNNVTKTLTAPLSFSMYEFSENIENKENLTSIALSLPSPSWNLTDIHVNFTDIEFDREIIDIEAEETNKYRLINRNDYTGQAVQINITDTTTIYGVQIYGSADSPVADQVKVQIRGYDSTFNRPDENVLREVSLNMSTGDPKWYIQTFAQPKTLFKGNYSLVLYTSLLLAPFTEYRWHYNNDNPKYPNLYVSSYSSSWSIGLNMTPFLYKLDQKLNFTIKPVDINMTAEIDGDSYPVLDGMDPIKGELSIHNVDYSSATDTLPISIKNNKSSSLLFNATYSYGLKHILNSGGTVSIKESFNNTWAINPNFTRPFTNPSNNYSIKFEYPTSWFNLTVFNSTGKLIESIDYIDDGQSIYILNDTITTDMGWKITANSKKAPFDADTQLDSYLPGQILKIPMTLPPSIEKANLTVVLLDRDGFFDYNYTEEDPPEIYIFEYTIPNNVISGTWTALIYWNNKSDASVQSQVFTISGTPLSSSSGGGGGGGGSTTVLGLDPLLVLTVSIIIIAAIAGSLTSYQMVKKLKRKRDLQMQKLRNKVIDSLNLNYIMISENSSGLNVYEQFFGGKEVDPTLISGFLAAIRSFGIELTGTFQQSQTIKLDFQNSKILMNEFRHFRLILIMGENPSDDFIESINNLSLDIEKEYGEMIRDFDGQLTKFEGIGKLIESNLNVTFLFPLKVVPSKAVKLTPAENSVLNKAKEIMKQNNLSYVFTSFLMDDQTYEPKRIKAIFGLIDKGIFQPMRFEDQASNQSKISK